MSLHLIHSLCSSLLTLLRSGRWRRVQTVFPQHLHTCLTHIAAPLVRDVRNPDEFLGERGHILGTMLCPLPELDTKLDELKAYRTYPPPLRDIMNRRSRASSLPLSRFRATPRLGLRENWQQFTLLVFIHAFVGENGARRHWGCTAYGGMQDTPSVPSSSASWQTCWGCMPRFMGLLPSR